MLRMAMGSDTGGSIRGPACYCGIVGLKPTYGRVSRRGVFPLSYSLDHCGPLTKTVEDTALTMQVIAGHDPLDPMSACVPVPDFTAGLGGDLQGLRLAYPRRFFANNPAASADVLAAIDTAAETLAALGAQVEQVELPSYGLFEAAGRVILVAEAYAIHEQDLKTRPLAYGRFTYLRVVPGAVLSAADLVQAFRLRMELSAAVNELLSQYDGIITASGINTAPRFDSFDRDAPRWATMLTIPFNVTGHPALALPIGFSDAGLPFGMQIVGRLFDEPTVLRIGAAYEGKAGWHKVSPPVAAN
jgi:aspartyl-tRNA(Asn)/glutamyl-tRNA(Gln) amidotransferase subunit A